MARSLIYLFLGVASLLLVSAVNGQTGGKQLTGQESFCAKLEEECPDYLVNGVVCSSTAVDYPSECEFWRENCRRKNNQRMTLVARELCTDTYCPANCRGEVRVPVCANYYNLAGVSKEKTYRNFCKYREAKCKQRNVFGIDLNILYYGECGFPTATLAPAATTVAPSLTEATTQIADEFEGTTLITELMGTFETEIVEETMATDIVEVTVLYTDEFVNETADGTLSQEEMFVTELVYEEYNATIEGTMAPENQTDTFSSYEEEAETTASSEELGLTTVIDGLTTEVIMDTTIVFDMEETDTPVSTDEMFTTSSPEELEETTSPPEELDETTSPEEILESTTVTSLLQQCEDEYQRCINGVSSRDVKDIIRSFFSCLETYQICVGEEPLKVVTGKEPTLPPSK